MAKKKLSNSRAARWSRAVDQATAGRDALESAIDQYNEAAAKLRDKDDAKETADELKDAADELEAAKVDISSAIEDINNGQSELIELRQEYEGWKENMPEGLQSSPVYEKLEAVCDIDFDTEVDEPDYGDALDDVEMPDLDWIDEAEGADLPLGFGRD